MANKLIFETGLDGSGFERGLSRLGTGALSTFKNTVLGAFGVFSVGQAVRGTIEWASKLQDSADALGVNVEWLQKMQNGAKLVGGDIEDITKMIQEMNKSRQDALLNPTGKNALAFGRAGMSQQDIKGMSSQDFVQKFIESFANGVSIQGSNDIQAVGGRSARNLLAAFKNQFKSDMPILSPELIEQLDSIGDQFTGLAVQMKVGLAPAIIAVANAITFALNQIKQSSAFLGGATSNWKLIDFLKLLTPATAMQVLVTKGRESFAAGAAAVVSEAADQQNLADQIAIAKKIKKPPPDPDPDFSPKQEQEKADRKLGMPATDALVSVGNFLGTSRGTIENLAQQQVSLLQKIETNTRRTTISTEELNRAAGLPLDWGMYPSPP